MVSHSDVFDPAFSQKTITLKKIEGAQLSKSGSPTAIIAGAMLALLPPPSPSDWVMPMLSACQPPPGQA
jgi:hypothetical protein